MGNGDCKGSVGFSSDVNRGVVHIRSERYIFGECEHLVVHKESEESTQYLY